MLIPADIDDKLKAYLIQLQKKIERLERKLNEIK